MKTSRRLAGGKVALAIAAALSLGGDGSVMAQGAGPLTGVWLTADGSTRVRFEACAQGSGSPQICGHVIWLKEPIDPASGAPWKDGKNDNPALRSRPLMGMALVTVKTDGAGSQGVWQGEVYNPLDGRTYTGSLTRVSANRLRLEGCALVIFCQSEIWERLP
jgi:uncharacterized protein (DUF2147 family)